MKAYLVTFTATTRIVVEDNQNPNLDDELFTRISDAAYEKMKKLGLDNYLNVENCDINLDTECPAGTFYADKNETI